jgi:hypothetical protein
MSFWTLSGITYILSSHIGIGGDTSCVEWFLYLDSKKEDEDNEPLAELTHTTDKDFHNIVNAEDWDRADIGLVIVKQNYVHNSLRGVLNACVNLSINLGLISLLMLSFSFYGINYFFTFEGSDIVLHSPSYRDWYCPRIMFFNVLEIIISSFLLNLQVYLRGSMLTP